MKSQNTRRTPMYAGGVPAAFGVAKSPGGGGVRRTSLGGRTSAAEVAPLRTVILGKFFLADIFRVNNSASSRAESGGVRRTFGGRSAEFPGNFLWRKAGGSARNRAESAQICADSRESAAEGLPPSI